MIKRITTLDDLTAEKFRLKAIRDERVDRLEAHWNKVRDREYRQALIRNTVSDIFKQQDTWQLAASAIKGSSGLLTLLGPLLGRGKGLMGKQWFWSGLGIVLPFLMKRVSNMDPGRIMEEVGVSIERVREHFKERMAEHRTKHNEE